VCYRILPFYFVIEFLVRTRCTTEFKSEAPGNTWLALSPHPPTHAHTPSLSCFCLPIYLSICLYVCWTCRQRSYAAPPSLYSAPFPCF